MIRALWLTGGIICFILGIIGLIVPGMPGTVFLIGAAYAFARSNPVWEQKMLDHKHMGPAIVDWRERRAISRKAKKTAVVTIGIGAVVSVFLTSFPLVLAPLTCMALAAAWLWTRPE